MIANKGQRRVTRQFLVFVLGGLLSACVDIAVMTLLLHRGIGSLAATTIGFIAGLAVNYLYHARFTFGVRATAASAAKYLSIVGINYVVTVVMVSSADHMFASPLAGKVASLPVVAGAGFLLSRRWAFR
jgi:putative flippase GtrA